MHLSYLLPVASSPIPPGETLADKYRIERIIGEGGMGVVVAAHHLELDQPVAIKFLLEGIADHEEGAERFRREARAAAKIHSDHVVRVLDVGVLPDGVRYMVMEYLEGCDLSEELSEKRSLPMGVACGIILEALDAVGHAHAVGIVHRDLKPANLFLARRPDGSQRIKVLDFGISKSIGSATAEQLSLTKTSAWIGSPLYMAPEQMQSARDVDARADIWSMGAILFEMLSGRPPYEADSLPQLCNLLITTDPTPISTLVPTLPADLAAAVMGCLVRNPEQRIQDAAQLAQAIARYATTATGSGVRLSTLDITELQPSGVASGFSAAPQMSTTPSRASYPGSDPMAYSQQPMTGQGQPTPSQAYGASPIGSASNRGTTHAAWGGTDPALSTKPEQKTGGSKWAIAALLFLGAGVGGFFAMKAGAGAPTPDPDLDAAMVATQADDQPAVAEPSLRPDPEPPAQSETEKPEKAKEAKKDEEDPSEKKPKEEVKPPAPVPRPRPVWRPRPVAAPVPAPDPVEPEPPAPAPAPKDSFSDFGGRR